MRIETKGLTTVEDLRRLSFLGIWGPGFRGEGLELVDLLTSHHITVRFDVSEIFVVAHPGLVEFNILESGSGQSDPQHFAIIEELMSPFPESVVNQKHFFAAIYIGHELPDHPIEVKPLRRRFLV